MFRKTFFILLTAAAPVTASAQQPAPTPAKPAQATASDTTKAKPARRTHRTATRTTKPATRAVHRDSTAHRDSVKP